MKSNLTSSLVCSDNLNFLLASSASLLHASHAVRACAMPSSHDANWKKKYLETRSFRKPIKNALFNQQYRGMT